MRKYVCVTLKEYHAKQTIQEAVWLCE